MGRKSKRPAAIGRREFIAGAIATGAISTLTVYTPVVAEGSDAAPCGILRHDPDRCVGCGVCGLMCSLYREGEAGPALSRSDLDRDPFTYDVRIDVCRQCLFPSCYFACPLKDRARLIDDLTGIVYVDPDVCIGCGSCVRGCRFDPPRTKLHPRTRVALNCDRCMERPDGPICVEYCNMDALSCGPREHPRRSAGRFGRS